MPVRVFQVWNMIFGMARIIHLWRGRRRIAVKSGCLVDAGFGTLLQYRSGLLAHGVPQDAAGCRPSAIDSSTIWGRSRLDRQASPSCGLLRPSSLFVGIHEEIGFFEHAFRRTEGWIDADNTKAGTWIVDAAVAKAIVADQQRHQPAPN